MLGRIFNDSYPAYFQLPVAEIFPSPAVSVTSNDVYEVEWDIEFS